MGARRPRPYRRRGAGAAWLAVRGTLPDLCAPRKSYGTIVVRTAPVTELAIPVGLCSRTKPLPVERDAEQLRHLRHGHVVRPMKTRSRVPYLKGEDGRSAGRPAVPGRAKSGTPPARKQRTGRHGHQEQADDENASDPSSGSRCVRQILKTGGTNENAHGLHGHDQRSVASPRLGKPVANGKPRDRHPHQPSHPQPQTVPHHRPLPPKCARKAGQPKNHGKARLLDVAHGVRERGGQASPRRGSCPCPLPPSIC